MNLKCSAALAAAALTLISCNNKMSDLYNINVIDKEGKEVSLGQYKGQVLLIVNTATRCGFTPQYEELEAMYGRLHEKGLEILDFPCNQFGNRAPESDAGVASFCKLNYDTKFPQFKKLEVNGENGGASLFLPEKARKGFGGFEMDSKLGPLLDKMMSEADPDYASKPDIKWNFTKFLVDRKGNVVARFEPTHNMADVEKQVEAIL